MVKMDASKITSKTSSLKALILKAWRERWTDIQWGINIKTILPRGVSGDLYNLADCILQQAMVGCGANQLVISYLKHSLASHLVSYAAVLQRIAKFDAFHKPHCILSLLEFLEGFLDSITCRSKMEEEILAFAVSSIILWLLQVYHYSLSKYPASNPIQSQELLEKSTSLLNSIIHSDFLLSMFYLAKQNDPDEYNEVTKKCQEITAFMMMNTQFKAPVTIHDTLQKICNMDVDKIAPLNNKPETVSYCLQALIAISVLVNPSADMQQLSSQLIMIQRIKTYPLSRLYCELIRACFISLNDASKDPSKQALWAAFTFLKLPQIIHCLHNSHGTNKDGDYSVEVVEAFEKLLQNTPLLDVVDAKNSCNSVVSLLEPLVKLNVISETQLAYFNQKRESKDVKLQKLEPIGLQGSVPSFITRAEPTLAGMLKTMGGDFHKTQESLYVMLCQIVGGTTLDTFLAVATVEGKLKLFVSRLIKFNEFALLTASEKGASQSKVYIFDISFLILCSIVQDYGADAVLEENGDSFFEQWVRDCMPQKGIHKSPEQILQKCDLQLIDLFIHHLSAPDFDFKNTNLKPHDLCTNVSGVIKEVLFAWEQGSISSADVKRMLDSLRQKMASLAVCASVWLCSYINVVHQDAFIKPLNMVQQFLSPPSEVELAQIDNFKERAILMCQIVRKMQYDVHPPLAPKSKILPFSHCIVSRQPILEQLQFVWEDIKTRGYLHIDATHIVESLLNTAGPVWFVTNLVKEMLKFRYQDDLDRSVDIILAMFHLNIEKCTESLLLHVLPQYLYNAKLCDELVEPQSAILARLCVYSIYAALEYSVSNKANTSRKRRHDESEDLDSMCSSSKVRRMNDNTSDSLYYSQGQNNMSSIVIKEPLQTALDVLYKSFSQLAGKNGDITPQTQFIFEFLVYAVQCGQDRAQIVLQKMPSEIVPTLIKALPDNFNVGLILRLYDLSTSYGRKDTARDLCLLRNMRLRPE